MSDVAIDLEGISALEDTVETKQVEDISLVFVPFEDTELRINQDVYKFRKGVATKVSRDQARILMECSKGYLKD